MAIRIVRLGSPRTPKEGLRIGTVRRPPRGVPKAEWASGDFFDVWYPNLAPSAELFSEMKSQPDQGMSWKVFTRRYRAEMSTPENRHTLALFAALSRSTSFAVGCYCEDESQCHRSILKALLEEAGAEIE